MPTAFDVTPIQNAHRRRGIGTYVRGLAESLNAQSEVPVEFWGWSSPLPFEIQLPHRLLTIRRPPMPQHRGAWIFAQWWLRQMARRSGAAVVHVSDPNALLPLPGRKLLTTVHDLIFVAEGFPRRRVVTRIGYQRYLAALRSTDRLFAVSTHTAADVSRATGRPLADITLAPPGIRRAPAGVLPHRGDRPYLLYVGGPDSTKNLDGLLQGLALAPQLPHDLLIAGHWTRRRLAGLRARLAGLGLSGRVQHVGFVPDSELESLLAGATALLMPSRREGFGLPIAEAMARGVPVGHSDIPVLTGTSQGAALTFDPDSPSDIARALVELTSDEALRQRLRAAGLVRAAEMTWDATLARTLAAYRELGGETAQSSR